MVLPSFRAPVKNSLLLAILLVSALFYAVSYPIPHALDILKNIIIAGAVFAGALGLGSMGTCFIKENLTVLELITFQGSFGYGILCALMIFFGLFGFWTRTGAWIILLISLLCTPVAYQQIRHALSQEGRSSSMYIPKGLWSFFLFAFFISLLLALVPVTYYDSLVYHLTLPQAYARMHHWHRLPYVMYFSFPQNLEMLWTYGLLLHNDVVVNFIGWSLGLLLLLAVIAYARRFLNQKTGIMAAALLSITPAFLLLLSGGYVDVGLASFSFMAFYAIDWWIEKPDMFVLCAAGVFTGLAVGIKYTGAITLFSIACLILGAREHISWPRRIKSLLLFCAIAGVVFAPWLIKNGIAYGNPFFPFAYQWIKSPLTPWSKQVAESYFNNLVIYTPSPIWKLPQFLWTIPLHSLGLGGGQDVLGDLGWATMIWCLPLLWLSPTSNSHLRRIGLYSCLWFIPWALNRPVLRFLMPLLPMMALLVGWGWTEGVMKQSHAIKVCYSMILGFFILSGVYLFFFVTDITNPFRVALGFESRQDYLSRKLNYYPAAMFVNEHLPENSRILIVGDQRSYYYHRDVIITPIASTNPLPQWANEAATANDLCSRLHHEGITHILINRPEMRRLQNSYNLFPFTQRGLNNWQIIQNRNLHILYHDLACDIFEILPCQS